MRSILNVVPFAASALAGTVLWDGRFNDMTSSTELDNWSFSNAVGPYQYYIHGTGNVTEYVNLSSDYKNPADTASKQGVKITIDDTSNWNNDGMRRTELIPQTSAAINKGKVNYHFSISRLAANPPGTQEEHQVAFFESHFTELKYGLISGESGTSDAALRWDVASTSKWNTTFEPGVWHNIAYEIDFDSNTVGFWHSTGADALTQVVAPVSASTSSNGADWHLGVLRLAASGSGVSSTADNGAEDWLFSGVYIESGDMTTSVAGAAGSSTTSTGSSTTPASSVIASTAPVAASSVSSIVASTPASAVIASPSVVSSSAAIVSSTVATSTPAAVVASSSSSSGAVVSSPVAVAPSSSVPTTLITATRAATTSAASAAASVAATTSIVEPSATVVATTSAASVATSSAATTTTTTSSSSIGTSRAALVEQIIEILMDLFAKRFSS